MRNPLYWPLAVSISRWPIGLTFCAISLLFLGLTAGLAQVRKSSPPNGQMFVYIGTYTGAKSKGIYLYQLDMASGKLTSLGLAAETVNPTFLAIHPNHKFLYAANEISRFKGQRAGAVSAFAIDPATGKLTFLNQQSSGGEGPCHLLVDKTGQAVLVANYGGGSVCVLPIQADGRLGESTAFIQHQGSSVNRQRQEGPHAHGIALDANNRFALVADLGLDKIMVYRLDPKGGTLTTNLQPWGLVKPGSGPRHIALAPNGRFAYVINEMGSSITAFRYNPRLGTLREIETVSTLPEDFKGANTCAEIEILPSGKYVYASNRGHNRIAVFVMNQTSGRLTFVEHQSTQGKTPRNFGIDPTGTYMIAANQDSDNMVMFRIDPRTGHLTPTEQNLQVGAPVCVVYLPVRRK